MYKLTFLGPAPTMQAGGFDWAQGKSRVLDKGTVRRLMGAYKYAQWELEEVVEPEAAPESKSRTSRRRGRGKARPEAALVPEPSSAPDTETESTQWPTSTTEEDEDESSEA